MAPTAHSDPSRPWSEQACASGDAIISALRERVPIQPFMADWIRASFEPDIAISALSCPRGSAKTWLTAQIVALALRPGSPLWREGVEALAVAGSLEQARVLVKFAREALADLEGEYRWMDSGQRLAATHKSTQTKLRVLSSDPRRAMGLASFGLIAADEPGAWQSRGGSLMFDALRQSLGKLPQQRLILLGTRSPSEPGSWWQDLIDAGSGSGVHVTELAAPAGEPWDSWEVIEAANPMVTVNADLRRTILRERDEARRNPTLRRSFEAYRLNRSTNTSNDMLTELEDWRIVEAREVPERKGRAIVGLDLGASRSWSAAWCLWASGRSECFAVCPGIPDIATKERQDGQPSGAYRRLVEDGSLIVDEGRRVSRPEVLIEHIVRQGISPASIWCDRFALGQLRDAVANRWPIHERVVRWSGSTEDIAAFRKLTKDGPLSIAPSSRSLAVLSLANATCVTDDAGSVRLVKRHAAKSRDDLAVAGTLAAGAFEREARKPRRRLRVAA